MSPFVRTPRPICGCSTTLRMPSPENLTGSMDIEVGGGGIGGDQAPPRGGGGGGVIWAKDGKSLIIEYGKEGRSQLARFDPETAR